MNAGLFPALASALGARLKGAYLGRPCRPDAWTLGFEMAEGWTLGFCWKPDALAAGLCPWKWPRGAPEEILGRHAQGAQVLGARALEGEPILRIDLAGGSASALLWEAVGRSANAFLLGDGDQILWSGRLLRGPFRSGRTGEVWEVPPPRHGDPIGSADGSEGEAYIDGAGPDLLRAGLAERGRNLALARLDQRAKALGRKAEALESDRREGAAWAALEPLAQTLVASGNLNRRGEQERIVWDYTRDPPAEVALPLDSSKTVRENAQDLFKKAQKGKGRLAATSRLLDTVREELAGLPARRETLSGCDDLQALYPAGGKASRVAPAQLRRTLPPGVVAVPLPKEFKGYAGKSAAGNDTVSFKLGRGADFWFHAEDYAGCHVVVRCPRGLESLPFDVEQAAALYAAAHSGAPPGNRLAVVVSRCKFLRRLPGAPGRVVISSRRMVFVDLPGSR